MTSFNNEENDGNVQKGKIKNTRTKKNLKIQKNFRENSKNKRRKKIKTETTEEERRLGGPEQKKNRVYLLSTQNEPEASDGVQFVSPGGSQNQNVGSGLVSLGRAAAPSVAVATQQQQVLPAVVGPIRPGGGSEAQQMFSCCC